MDKPFFKKNELTSFLAILLLGTTLVNGFIISRGGKVDALAILVMWIPGISALITRLIFHRNVRNLGWKWPNAKLLLFSYIAPGLVAFGAYSLVWASSLGGVSTAKFTEAIQKSIGVETLSFWTALLLILTIGFLVNTIASIGEEIGWGGYLTRGLSHRFSLIQTSLVVGGLWAIWHWPAILYTDYYTGSHAVYALVCFSAMAIGFSFLRTWLVIDSGSLLTACFLHASHNLFIQAVFDTLTVNTGNTKLFTTEFGIVIALSYGCAAGAICYMWKRRSRSASATPDT